MAGNTSATGAATRLRALPELALVVALFAAYKLARVLIEGDVQAAFVNAWRIWDLERALRLPREVSVQQALLTHDSLLHLVNSYYAYVHFPATGALLGWVYLRRPEYYRWVRRTLAALTGTALVIHVLLPLAPPRMLAATGMVDTGRLVGPAVYGDPTTDTLSNQYAAMPSLHVGWALVVAVVLITVTRGRWRWAWALHPALTVVVVVVTGNHYWLDGLLAAALLGVVLFCCPQPDRQPYDPLGGPARPVDPVVSEEQPA
ncbi:phosphatase PAP2 family protein [Micromonospora sp. GCM10011542]|uniref:phosphatase PAP2 family protein n=1 Tax=Micromonospora sp. GCM10011542 TaxID=3317337 RepID=UPI00361503C0